MSPSPTEANLDEKIVQTIVTRLGYTEQEVKKFVKRDKHSFVGVLYHKLLADQQERQITKCQNSSATSNDISAKLPVQPSFVPSVGSLTQLNPVMQS